MNSRSCSNSYVLFCGCPRGFGVFNDATEVAVSLISTSYSKKVTSRFEDFSNNYDRAFSCLSLFIF